MKNSKNSLKTDVRLILRAFKLLYEISPRNMVWRTANCIISQLSPYFGLYMSALIIDEITAGSGFERLITLAVITVAGMLLLNTVNHMLSRVVEETDSILWHVQELFMLKAQCRMQYKYYEDPKTALLRRTIRNHSNYGGHGIYRVYYSYWSTLSCIINIVMSVSLTASMLVTTAQGEYSGLLGFINSPFSAVILLGLIGINVAVNLISARYCGRIENELWNEHNTIFARSNAYVSNLPDARIFNAPKLTLKRNREALVEADYINKLTKNGIKNQLFTKPLNAVMNIGLAVYVGAKAFIGVFGIGSFVLYRGTVEKFVNAVAEFTSTFGNLRYNNRYLEELYTFLDLPDDMYKGTLSVEKREDNRFEIEFRNVSFKYPGAETYAIKNVSFKFRIGERLAFVGMNGSGKTTFIKLLCRLYDPTEGKILLNGIDITRYKYDEYLKLFSVVFQDFYTFGFTLGEAVSASLDYDGERVKSALERVGFGERLAEYPNGLDTVLTREADNEGVDVSGGEAQKIALARALYKNAPFMILDEPTAALDPIAEADVYSRFNDFVEEKTAIYISHRLSSCRFCDNIVVFNEGEIVQYGSHDTLVAEEKGKYHELWNAQAQHYGK